MYRFRHLLFVGFLAISMLWLGGCERDHARQLRISANPWVGFTPLVYAQQKGWLERTNIKFLWVVGLEENIKLYRQGLSDGFVATQYEYFSLQEQGGIKPYFLFDRSAGADVILSNTTIGKIKDAESIDAYLEITGLNKDLLQAFLNHYEVHCENTVLHASDPESMSMMKPPSSPSLLIAYEPYATVIENNGFHRVASTRDITQMMVIDALWLNTEMAQEHAEDIRALKKAVDRAIVQLHRNPKEYYDTVAAYLKDQSFEEFQMSLEGIEWIHKHPSQPVLTYLRKQNIETDAILP